jgi:Na+/melibiose symporter-like transporter
MAERLKRSLLYSFGVGDLFFTLLVCMEVFFFNAFLTDYAKFSLKIYNIIVVATGSGDILCALVAGVVLQRLSVKLRGGYRSWLLLCPPIVVPLFILQFSRIGGEYMAAAIIIFGFLASHLLWNVGYAATGALAGSLTQRPDERTILSSSRAQGMAVASLLYAYTGPRMITFFGTRTSDVIGYTVTIVVFGILMLLGYLYIYRITAVVAPIESRVIQTENKEATKTLMEIAGLVFRNPPLLLLMIAETFRNTSLFLIQSFAFYYFGYVLNNAGFLEHFILAISVATFFGTVIAAWIGVRIGKRNAYWMSLILSAFVFFSAAFIETNTYSFTIVFSIGSMLGMIAGSMITALFADTVVYGEWKTGKNIQAFIMSLLMLPIKLGLLLRSGIMAVGFTTIGYIANTTPTPEVVNGISSIMIYSPALTSAIAAAVFYIGYRIDEKDVLQMQDEIAAG